MRKLIPVLVVILLFTFVSCGGLSMDTSNSEDTVTSVMEGSMSMNDTSSDLLNSSPPKQLKKVYHFEN